MSDNISEKMVSDELEKTVSDDSKKFESLPKLVSNCFINAKTRWLKFKDEVIQFFSEKAEVVRRLRSEAREGKAKAASHASQEHTIVDIGGGSSTAQNEPPPNHQGGPVGDDHQPHNGQANESTNQTDNHAPESGSFSTLVDNESAPDNEPAPDNCGNDTVFMVVGEGLSTWLGVKVEGEKTIEAKIFLYFLAVFNILGIISLSYSLCLSGGPRSRGRGSIAARLAKTVCYVVVGLAVVTGAGLQLPNHVMVWVIPLVWVITAPAIFCYAIK